MTQTRTATTSPVREPMDGRRWILLVGVYFALAAVARILVSGSAELDEAEQLINSQALSWGYGPQPPLYTWIQTLLMSVFGTNIAALALFKAVLLFTQWSLVFLCVKYATGQVRSGVVAMLSMFLIPQFLWESQRDLTHTVLAATMAVGTFYLWLRLIAERKTIQYILLGLCAAAGLLSKFNYGVFFGSLILASLTLPQSRAALRDWRILLSVALMVALLFVPTQWMLAHTSDVMADSEKLFVRKGTPMLRAWGEGLIGLVLVILRFLAPMLLFTVPLLWQGDSKTEAAPVKSPAARLASRTIMFGIGMCVVAVFAFYARFKGRWFQPLLILAPVYVGLLAELRLTPAKVRWMSRAALVAALVVLILLPAGALTASFTHWTSRWNAPYDALGAELRRRGCDPAVVIADDRLTGGNMRLCFPRSLVVCPEWDFAPIQTSGSWLIVWDPLEKRLPKALEKLVAKRLGQELKTLPISYVEAPLKYFPKQSMKLAYVKVTPERNREQVGRAAPQPNTEAQTQ